MSEFKPSDDPEAFKAKLAYWRENGAPSCTFKDRHGRGVATRAEWRDAPSKFYKERRQIERMKEAGLKFDRYDPNLKDKQIVRQEAKKKK